MRTETVFDSHPVDTESKAKYLECHLGNMLVVHRAWTEIKKIYGDNAGRYHVRWACYKHDADTVRACAMSFACGWALCDQVQKGRIPA